jgi:hypothetical protein
MTGRMRVPGRAFIIGMLAVLTAIPEPVHAQGRDFPGALFSVVTSPFRALSRPGRHRVARPPAPVLQPLFRLPRPFASNPRPTRKAVLRRNRKAVAAQTTAPDGVAPVVAPVAGAAAAATAATVAAPSGAAARPSAPDNVAPTVGAPPPAAAPSQARPAARPPAVAAWVGPLYWPYATDDLLDYVFLPSGSSDRFWSHGAGDLMQALFVPAPQRTPSWIEMCGSRQGGAGAWLNAVEQATKPTDAQRGALDELRKAVVGAINGIKDACPAAGTAASPPQRFPAMADRIWAMRQAVVQVRMPFETFYNSLSGNQKARLTDESARTEGRAPDDAAARPSNAMQACAMMTAPWPAEQIEQRVRPNDEQRRGLETLRMTMMGMGQMLMASCPQEDTTTPLARLNAAEKRLNAMLYATRIVMPTLNGFYASLSDQQKAGFLETAAEREATGGARPRRGER